ncbi:phospholipase D-like domain-containing anti-phage protein [Virgibacillus byunsanensis]|uniref:Phospholipase D-like domain-containing anti-phage protein n=1 Tax=Virgibacillus byunsanensis TaxID=570945 RepID=A0ABW3LTX4_9BACI
MIQRYSSRLNRLDQSFLTKKLEKAKHYDRIAGYFSSSILEIAGEAIDKMEGKVRIICNSDLNIEDVKTASAAVNAIRKEWCSNQPEERFANMPKRLHKLYELLKTEKLSVKVLPNNIFGLIHGKAGVITLANGSKTAFMGSVNETYSAWRLNYEIMWEDDSDDAVQWVQEEFDYFWNSPYAVPLSEFVVEDINRISKRSVINTVEKWKEKADPASSIVEAPVYRQEYGLWEHQKYFVNKAFNDHKKTYGARYILADMVGLGKTVQLALAGQLMALYGDKPVLVIAPKTLLWQWQDEINNLLDMPSAVWTGKEWVDENGIRYPSKGDLSIKRCPRRVGIISQGLITANSNSIQHLLNMEYECVIVDEAHRARRKNQGSDKADEKPNPNNLMNFLIEMSRKTKSMLLATATPVQLYPVEAWDLLYILSQSNDSILGSRFSKWRTNAGKGLDYVMQTLELGRFDRDVVDWIRNPFPPADEGEATFGRLRRRFDMTESDFVVPYEKLENIKGTPEERRFGRIIDSGFMTNHNPYIRNIVRRTRDFLETTTNPETGEPYLKAVKVKLFGETDKDAIILPPYLQEAYQHAEQFSELLQKRVKGGGFLKSLLLRRVGSTMIAGKNTAEKMLLNWGTTSEESDYEYDEYDDESVTNSEIKNITNEERQCLIRFVSTLEANKDKDPKYQLVIDLLLNVGWLERGCIIFSQFFDSAYWIADSLSEEIKGEKIGIYAGGDKSGIITNGVFERMPKDGIKDMVKRHELRVLIGTDAASEGLNLQALGSLINLDLPWNPTRLEQRKGRIQRIGQVYDEVWIYNMRYKGSVEDRVHSILSERLESIHGLFGQIPDVLQDVWVDVALNNDEEAQKKIDAVPTYHPFEMRYHVDVGRVDWENCVEVLDTSEKRKHLMNGWS